MSFEVTVTPQVYNVEVEVNPSVQPFDVQVITQQDLADLVEEAKQYAEDADDSADSASASASSASASASASASSANSASSSASSASSSASTATTQAGIATTQAGIATTQAGIATTKAQDASQSANDALASEQASAQSASDALQSEQNALASEQASAQSASDALASEQSASASASTATAQAGIATTQAGIATTQAGNALTSANNALNSANAAAASASSASQTGTSTLLTGFTTGSNTTIAGTDTILQAFQKAQGQINARVSGTGASGQVAFWTGTGTQSGDNGFTWDNVNKRLGVGTNVPLTSLYITDQASINVNLISGTLPEILLTGSGSNKIIGILTSSNTPAVRPILQFRKSRGSVVTPTAVANGDTLASFSSGAYDGSSIVFSSQIDFIVDGSVGSNSVPNRISFLTGTNASTRAERMSVFSDGNIGINTGSTNAGFRLDVNGTARVQGALTTNLTNTRIPFVGTGGVLSESTALTFDNGNSRLSSTNISANSTYTGGFDLRTVTSGLFYLFNAGASNFVPTSGNAQWVGFGATPIINQTGGANGITRGLFVNPTLTSAADWRSIEWSNNTGRGLWGVGTANNALAGATHIGSASNANASAILELTSTTRGLLLPRMTSAERDLIASPVAGLVVYNTTDNKISWYNGTAWANI
jgi:hypothetical protein